jgi:hypothetical protein
MSKVVEFRTRIMQAISTSLTDLQEVEWYDGIFDEDDIVEWSHKVPCAYVSVLNAPTEHHTTGELNADLRCVVVILDADTYNARDADERVWSLCERLSELANLNRFGDPNAAPATMIKFKRLVHPELRRNGVAVGIVEWQSGLTIGKNQVDARDFVWNDGVKVTEHPRSQILGYMTSTDLAGVPVTETVDLTPTEDDV